MKLPASIALLGFGEVGQVLAADLCGPADGALAAWDRLFPDPGSTPSIAASRLGRVRAAAGMREALEHCELVICAVTAGECVAAAAEAAGSLAPGAWYFDLNSVAPATRREAARLVESAGGRYVEAAVMSPIGPQRIASPMLVGGAHAAEFAPLARALGFAGVEVFADALGRASAAKMCRSVMIKGLEALLTESLLAARHHGVETAVLASLRDLFPHADWPSLARYMISRSLQHGTRRAEEMREVARTVREAGVEPWMSRACAERQDWAAAHAGALHCEGLEPMLDELLAGLRGSHRENA